MATKARKGVEGKSPARPSARAAAVDSTVSMEAAALRSPTLSAEQLLKIPAFSVLTAEDAKQMMPILRERPVARGERVFAEGSLGDGLYAILSGRVSIMKKNAKGGERELAALEKDEVFGEMDLISDRPHTAGAVAAESGRLLVLPKAAFQKLLTAGNKGAVEMLKYFTRMLAARLDSNNRRMMEMLERGGSGAGASSEFAEFKRRLLREWTF